jgi:hypothetical protein
MLVAACKLREIAEVWGVARHELELLLPLRCAGSHAIRGDGYWDVKPRNRAFCDVGSAVISN